MGNFTHHINGGAVAGIVCAGIGAYKMHLPFADTAAAGAICVVSSLLPDLDSPQSKPTDMLFGVMSIVVPILLLEAIGLQMLTTAEVMLVALSVYTLVQYAGRQLMGYLTTHRGIFHSIPMALIWGCIVFIAFRHSPSYSQNWIATSSLIGFMTHLLIDELFSFVNIKGVRLSPKESFGTALKFWSPSNTASILAYMVLSFLLYLCITQKGILEAVPRM
jgi:membrane-bound metal-dependent hydrolase YbcI (DUF457 family)